MKKTITLLLTLGLLLGLLPVEAAAFAGDIYRAGDVKQVKMADGSLSLQNGYVHVTLHKLLETYSYLTVVPAAKPDEDFLWNSQTPRCNYTTYNQGVPTTEGVVTELKSMTFVSETPNGKTNAIKAEYDLLSSHSHVAAQVTVYYEIVQLKEIGPTAKDDTWGVLTTVGSIRVEENDQVAMGDPRFTWGYNLNAFTSMGHRAMLEASGGPAIKSAAPRCRMCQMERLPRSPRKVPPSPRPWRIWIQRLFPRVIPGRAIRTAFTSPRSIRTATTGPIPLWDCRNTIKTAPSRPIAEMGQRNAGQPPRRHPGGVRE